MLTSPRDYFALESFRHACLFAGVQHVWEALDRLQSYLADYPEWAILGEVSDKAVLRGPVYLGPGTIVEPCAMIIGPAVIGGDCLIRHSAYVRGYVVTGDHCVIGHCSEVKSSILLDRAVAPHFNYIGDSIIGNDVNLGAGAVCANLRLDEAGVVAHDPEGHRRPTGRRKLGAIVGDGSRTACNVTLNPGALLPPNSLVRAATRPVVTVRSDSRRE